MKYKYIGFFVNRDELLNAVESIEKDRLPRLIDAPHVTFKYHPEEVDTSLFGIECEMVITGYGNDGYNEGVRVELFLDNEPLLDMLETIDVPHITVSLRDGECKAVNTKYLEYRPVPYIRLKGVFGGHTFDGSIDTVAR